MAGLKSLGFDARQTVFFCAPFSEILIYFPFKMCPGRVISKLLCSGEKEVDLAVQSAKAAFNVWSQMSGMERSRVLLEAARIIRVCCGSSPPLLERPGSVSQLSYGLMWLLGAHGRISRAPGGMQELKPTFDQKKQ